MADFSDVVKELKQTNSKLDRMAEAADPAGPVMAAESEKVREEETRENKQTSLLERIAKAVEGGLGGSGDKKVGKNLMIFGAVPGIIGAMLKGLGIGALVGAGVYAAFLAFKDGIAGIDWAKELGMEGETGFVAGFLGGKKGAKGWMNAAFQGMKGFAAGATAGLPFGPVGVVVGALVGGALFGIAGYFGAEKVAEFLDPYVFKIKTLLGMTTVVTPEEIKAAEKKQKDMKTIRDTANKSVADLVKQLQEAEAAAIPDQKRIGDLKIAIALANKAAVTSNENYKEAVVERLTLERAAEKNALNTAEEALKAKNFEIFRLGQAKRKAQAILTRVGKDTEEGIRAQQEIDAIDVKIMRARIDQKDLKTTVETAELALLREDRKIAKEAKEAGVDAPWRTRLNLSIQTVKDNWNLLAVIIPQIWRNYVFDPGSGDPGGLGQGTSMKIFGIDFVGAFNKIKPELQHTFLKIDRFIPAMFKEYIFDPGADATMGGGGTPMRIFGVDIVGVFKTAKQNLQTTFNNWDRIAAIWVRNYIFDPGGDGVPMRVFGFDMVIPFSIKAAWNKFKQAGPIWFKNNIFDPGDGNGVPMRIFGFDLVMPKFAMDAMAGFDKLKTIIPRFFKKYIFDPGSEGDMTGAGTPMKIFGVELKWPKFDLQKRWDNLSNTIVDMLPTWLTDPVKWFSNLFTSINREIIPKTDPKAAGKAAAAGMESMRLAMMGPEVAVGTGKYGPAGRHGPSYGFGTLSGKQFGGELGAGDLALVGEGGREIFMSDRAGTILSAGLTRQMLGGIGGGGANIVSAPTVVNAPQSSMTMVGTPIVNDNPILRAVNASALT